MQIHHVTQNVASHASGVSYSVVSQCEALARLGNDVHLHVMQARSEHAEGSYRLHTYPVTLPWPSRLPRLDWSEPMRRALRDVARAGGILHSHNLWSAPTFLPALCVRGTPAKLVVAPRGTLDPADFNLRWVRKRVMWHLATGRGLHCADVLQATAPLEAEHFRQLGLTRPIALIPNGVHMPAPRDPSRPRARELLYFGRVHPKKGIDTLLKAWARIEDRFADWRLTIAGPSVDPTAYGDRMRALAAELRLRRVSFEGFIPENAKQRYFDRCAIYVLPTHGDNWANTVTQALSSGVPAIVTRNAPWEQLVTRGCGWWIDDNVDALVACLEGALVRSLAELEAMGTRGRAWMSSTYGWDRIGAMTAEVYEWLLGGARPDFVVD